MQDHVFTVVGKNITTHQHEILFSSLDFQSARDYAFRHASKSYFLGTPSLVEIARVNKILFGVYARIFTPYKSEVKAIVFKNASGDVQVDLIKDGKKILSN